MRRYALSEMILRQLIREEVRSFSYTGIGIGTATEAQKTSYIVIAAKALGVTLGVAGLMMIKDSWDNWSKKIDSAIVKAENIEKILTDAAVKFNSLPTSLSLQNLTGMVTGASTPATPTSPAPATPAPGSAPAPAPQQERRRLRGEIITEAAAKDYRVIKTDYGDLVDTNAIEILTANVKAITGSGTRIIPQLKLENLKLANLDRALESMLPLVGSAISKISNLNNKDKKPTTLASAFEFNAIKDASTLAPVVGVADDGRLAAQKGIANAFMCDALAVLIYDKMCNEVLENVGRIVSMKDTITKGESEAEKFDEMMKSFGASWIQVLKAKLSAFAQKIISGEVFKE
jgi:hypothetical protein